MEGGACLTCPEEYPCQKPWLLDATSRSCRSVIAVIEWASLAETGEGWAEDGESESRERWRMCAKLP